jgi:hypothetical protein
MNGAIARGKTREISGMVNNLRLIRGHLKITSGVLAICLSIPTLAAAQSSDSASTDETAFSYLGFYSGMSVKEVGLLVQRRDGSLFDLDTYCKASVMASDRSERSCNFPSPQLRESGLQLSSVSFTLRSETSPLEIILISREEPDFLSASTEFARIADRWEAAGRQVNRADWVQPQTPSCRHLHAWIDDQDQRSKVDVDCVPLMAGERPKVRVVLHRVLRRPP